MAVIKGTAFWASIETPNTKYEPQWSVDLIPDSLEEFKALKDAGFKVKTMKDGQEALHFRRKCERADGQKNKQPRLLDANKNPIDLQVGNGSKVAVQYDAFKGSGKFGPYQGLDLRAVQVLDLVSFGGVDGDEFETVDPDEEF